MPKILNFEQLLKHILRVIFQVWGSKINSVGLDHFGSQPFNFKEYKQVRPSAALASVRYVRKLID